ncbi:MAG TPA: DNA mismatch repair endonuclease MutL [Candidatus Polarisedimenticolaceae bacterium]|nr:DNA mismatch repair endonuclease MutL [Candidatus Polarisedimenticolaceae bacterium]
MGRIRVLDDHLINRIAAGEVVERPASVVKELLENSLDAGATTIDVVVEDGGRRRILVADDGEGMGRDDALLALERHATSKLGRFEDLDAIATLGFRGEALPSIAAVSRFLMRTAPDSGEGTEVEARAGKIAGVRPVARARGTAIEVGGIFFNVPARRKFLRAAPTELAHIVRMVSHYALAHPSIRFRLDHDGRRLLDAPPAADRAERIAQVHGRPVAETLIPFSADAHGIRASGFAGRPVDASPRRDAQHLFVNGRLVQDRVLAHAIHEAYGDTVPRGHVAPLVLFLEVDPARVDVNVHPQKTEVRFARSSEIHDAVRDAVAGALASTRAVPRYAELRPLPATGPAVAVAEEAARPYRAPAAPAESFLQEGSPALDEGRRATPLAQYRDSYIVAQDRDGLLLVDQHVAHERVLFERYLADAEQDVVGVQRLLFAKTIELTADEAILLEAEAGEFRRLGFLFEPFGGRAIKLDGVPALAKNLAPEGLLHELLGEAARTRSTTAGAAELRRRLVTTASCQAAIKVNYPLAREGMQRLLDDLFATANPTTCPHGRPILFRLTLEDIERAFRRR